MSILTSSDPDDKDVSIRLIEYLKLLSDIGCSRITVDIGMVMGRWQLRLRFHDMYDYPRTILADYISNIIDYKYVYEIYDCAYTALDRCTGEKCYAFPLNEGGWKCVYHEESLPVYRDADYANKYLSYESIHE